MGRSSEEEESWEARRCCSRMKVRSTERKAWVRIVEMVGSMGVAGWGIVEEVVAGRPPVRRGGEKRRK